MNENLIRKLTCAIKESSCGCNKPKCTCNDSNRKVTDVKILPVQGVPGEKQLIVYYDDCTQATYQYNDPSKDGDTFIEKFKIENSILKGVYNTGEEVQVLNLRNYALARDVRDLANKINHIKDYIFEDVEIDFSCDGTLPSSCCSKPFREGNKVYYINCKGEKEFLFDVTDDKGEEPAPTPTPPPAPQPKPKYTIKSRAVNGGITVPSSITVEEGTEVEIGAFVPENKLFKHWTLNNQVVGTTNTIKVIADSNKEYVAIIEDKPTPKPDPVPEPPKPEPTPPTPKPTPVITYDIEADTTPVNITIDDTTQEREVCFSYKVVKNTTLEGNTTKEYVSNYTSNRAKDRFCVTTSTNQQLPLEVNVDGTVLNKTFTINVTDNRTPDNGFFEIDYPNSTGIEATPEGPRLINQCYTDGTGGIVTYTIKLTERSNPFVGIPDNLPQGIEVTLSEDKKTMTIKTICNVISNAVGKIFDVFDFFKRKIQVLLGTAKTPAPVDNKITVQVSHAGDIDHPYTENFSVDARTSFTPTPAFTDTHDIEFFQVDGRTEEYSPTIGYIIEGGITFSFIYKRKQNVIPAHPEYITVTLRKRYAGGSPLQQTEEKIQVPYGGTFTPEMPEVEDHWREKIASDVPGREHEVYLNHPDYRPTPFTNLTSDITVVLDYVYEDPNPVEEPQYNVRYNLTYSFIDYDNSTPINVQGLPTGKEIAGVTDLEDGPIYYTVEVPEVPGYRFVEFIVEGGTPITMLPYSTNIWSDTNITFKYVKLATDSYGKPLPFEFKPAIINVLHYHYTPTVGNPTGTYMYSTTTFGLVVENPGAVTSSTNLIESARAKNEYPIRIADNANGVSLDNREYSVFPSEYSYNQNKPYNSELYMYVGSPKYNYGNSDGDYNNRLTAAKESTFDSVMDAKSIAETTNTFNRYEKKELTVTLSSGVYKFKPEDILELNVSVHAAPHDGYRKGRQVNETEDLLYAVVHRDIYATYTPYISQPDSFPEDEETPAPQPPTEDDTEDYSIYVVRPAIVLNGSNNGDYGPFNYTIAYNGVEQNIQSITWDIPSLGINSGTLTNNSGFSFSFSVNDRLTESTLDVHQAVTFENAKDYAETYTLTVNAMFGYE